MNKITEAQNAVLDQVAAQVSVDLAQWMRGKLEQGMTLDEVAAAIDQARELVQNEVAA